MQSKDHLALGRCLLRWTNDKLPGMYKIAFLLGSIEPDFNIVTYIRVIHGHSTFHGHDAKNSQAHVMRSLTKFQNKGVKSTVDFFELGTAIHYIADMFTFPHNGFWEGNLKQHAVYEEKLHKVFMERLHAAKNICVEQTGITPARFLRKSHAEYCKKTHGIETDCRYIIGVCRRIFEDYVSIEDRH